MDGVVSLHEIIHEVKKKKHSEVIFKVDFEKAYDKVNWNFLYQMMIKKGFGDNSLFLYILLERSNTSLC